MESSATADPGVIAITDDIVETAGCVTWWRLSGSLPLETLQSAWGAAGHDDRLLPKQTTPAEALARAVRQHQSKRVLARPLGGRRGWALVNEDATDDGLDYQVLCKAHVEEQRIVVACDDDALRRKIEDAYVAHRAALSATDVSMWISGKLISQVQAVKLRDTGGVYFVPRDNVATFVGWAGLLRGISDHVVYELPALRSEEALEAIMVAVITEADKELAAMEEELDMDDLGVRALRTRERRCEAVRFKIATYEHLLGQGMEDMQDRLGALQASIVEAAILADGGEQQDLV